MGIDVVEGQWQFCGGGGGLVNPTVLPVTCTGLCGSI